MNPLETAHLLISFEETKFGISQGLKEETASFQRKNLRSHILKLCLALPIAFQQRSKWPLPPLHFDTEQGNLTLTGYLDQGKAMSAVCAGDGGDAEGVTSEEHVEEAAHAETAVRTAQCCDESDTSYCFWLMTPQV